MYVVGQTLVLIRFEESNWFQQRFILDFFKVILFLLFCLPPLTLSYSYFFSCSMVPLFIFPFVLLPFSFLEPCISSNIALQQQFFVASGMGTSYLNILLTSYHHQKNAESYRNNTEEEGRNKGAWQEYVIY